MRWIYIVGGFIFLFSWKVTANNIQVSSEVKVVGFSGVAQDTAIVELSVSWENAWKDDYNWDAAWIFLKYRKKGAAQSWHPAYLSENGHEALTPGYTFTPGKTGTKVVGVFVSKSEIWSGRAETKLRLKWALKANTASLLTKEDFGPGRDQVYVMAYAIEMVYVPFGPFYLGDQTSNNSFLSHTSGVLPESADILDNVSGYSYSLSKNILTGSLANVTDHSPAPDYANSTMYFYAPAYWQVDFKTPKKILYFGVCGARNYPTCVPAGNWYLKGSNDLNKWEILYCGVSSDWTCTAVAYPIQKALRVHKPGNYRYYRIEMSRSNRPSDNGVVIQSIAMTESNLYSSPYLVEHSEAISLGNGLMAADLTEWNGTLPAAYPKGMDGFYCMKYEVSQEQYVDFLNTLTLTQQKARVENNDFVHMQKGDYVFGNLKRPNCRNGIAVIPPRQSGQPAVFVNNLNAGNDFYAADDGQNLPCNYLSPADMLAYCDWCGFRPMSELEYEKAARPLYPQKPQAGEYVWNTAGTVNNLDLGISSIKFVNTAQETPTDYRRNVNAGGRIAGPVRCGAFATSQTDQVYAGATVWGIMEMSGNLSELCYSSNVSGRNFRTDDYNYAHGDGNLAANGNTDIGNTYWPLAPAAFALRGGSFASATSLLRTSDRTQATGNYFSAETTRDSTVGFRGVRSVAADPAFGAGDLLCPNGLQSDTICYGENCLIRGAAPGNATGKITYNWYVSENNGTSWELLDGQTGMSLYYDGFVNETTAPKKYLFKRRTTCATGSLFTTPVTILVSNRVTSVIADQADVVHPALGYPCDFPNYTATGMTTRWIFADGSIHAGAARIDNYQSAYDGNYYVCFVNNMGCEGERQTVKVEGRPPIRIRNYGAYRAWEDGTYARSANEYRNPPVLPYLYEGDTGSGVYKIDVDGSEGSVQPLNAYCDMEHHGGGWTLLFHHNVPSNITTDNAAYFWADKSARQYNINNPTADLYSIIYLTEYFRGKDGKFHYWLNYPERPTLYNIWKQSANPESYTNANRTGYVAGYQAIDVRATGSHWGGMGKTSASGTTPSYIDGTFYTTNWWFSIGCTYYFNSTGPIPGPNDIVVRNVYWWVK